MRKGDIAIQTVVYAIIALVVFTILFAFLIPSMLQAQKIKSPFKFSSIDEARSICESYCSQMQSFSNPRDALLSDYCSKWVSIKVSFEGKIKNVPVKCWWPPVNVYCEKKFQVVTENGLERLIVKPLWVPNTEQFNYYALTLFGKSVTYQLAETHYQGEKLQIVVNSNGNVEQTTISDIVQKINPSASGNRDYREVFLYLGTKCVMGDLDVLQSLTIKIIPILQETS